MKIQKIYKTFMMWAVCSLVTMPGTAQSPVQVAQSLPVQDTTVCGLPVAGAVMQRNAGLMTVNMDWGLRQLEMKGDRAVVLAPVIVNGSDSLELQPVGLYGRTRWYQYLRAGEKPLGGDRETSLRYSQRPETYDYSQTVRYADWMNGAQLVLKRCDYGCCRTLLDAQEAPLTAYRELTYTPLFHFVCPVADKVKSRELSGRAFIDFPVNLTTIYPEYRGNTRELAKIIATIDSVRNDKDVTVSSITIKGFASPEGPYDNNIRLAKGRTEALKQYVQNLYHFAPGFIATDYEPEDWQGLRDFVESSGLTHRNEILAIIDSNLAPDPKNDKIQATYPEEYQFLLQTVYPALRHSDYKIEYTIRTYTDIDEIRQIMDSAPQKLSLNEMFLLAQSLEPGSDEYNKVFETAVHMYPGDETANLNAANSAMSRNDLIAASAYLDKAGSSTEAVYARGICAALAGDYRTAEQYFSQAAGQLPEARESLRQIKEITKFAN